MLESTRFFSHFCPGSGLEGRAHRTLKSGLHGAVLSRPQFSFDSFNAGDYSALLPWLMVVVAFVILFNLLADLSYAWLDPRIRLD